MIKIHENAYEFLKWFEKSKTEIAEKDLARLHSAAYILSNTSSFEWYWLWPKLRLLLLDALDDKDLEIIDS